MGGNGSYSKEWGGVPEVNRTHFDSHYRIDGHKIIISKKSPYQVNIPMNSNSESPIYLIGKVDKTTKNIKVKHIAIYEKHKIVGTIDLVFDSNGNVKPFNAANPKQGAHFHSWTDTNGDMGRVSGDDNNHHPIPSKYMSLITKVENFNKANNKWNGEKE